MDPVRSLALLIHIFGFMLWVGSLIALAHALIARNAEKDETIRLRFAALARKEGMQADIGFLLALVGGGWLLSMAFSFYMHQPWMHTKLTLVAGLLGLHGYLRVKAKRASRGEGSFPSAVVAVIGLVAALIVSMIAFKPGAR